MEKLTNQEYKKRFKILQTQGQTGLIKYYKKNGIPYTKRNNHTHKTYLQLESEEWTDWIQ